MAKAKTRSARSLDTLVNRLAGDGLDVPLSVTAQAMLLLGSGLVDAWLAHLASTDDPLHTLALMWKTYQTEAPWLEDYLGPLTNWMDGATPDRAERVRRCAGAFHDVDFHATVEAEPYCGDILGPLYLELRSRYDRKRTGAFYTPMNVALMMGMMTSPEEGKSVFDPCCGSGAMLVGAARAMRKAGRNPANCLWAANDIDPMAVALCGVQLTAHGMGPHIWLTVGDGLLIGSGRDDDPHVTQRPWWERDPVRAGLAESA